MKQLLFLLLFPCLAMAQYQGNANQKITLGEQTTADGLVFRGVASIDTVTATSKITRANKQDTSAYLLLDTVTNLLWHYKTGSNAWTQAGGGVSVSSFSAGTTGLTPSTATTGAVTLGGTLAVANGGTGSATQNFVDLSTNQTVNGIKTFKDSLFLGNVVIGKTKQNNNSVRFGINAGLSTGDKSVAIGTNTLQKDTGGENVAIGFEAGKNLTTGVRNMLLGSSAGASLTTGGSNVAFGSTALLNCTDCSGNTAIGRESMEQSTSGASNNTFVGYSSGYSNTTGDNNSSIGFLSGYGVDGTLANTTGSNNTFIGYQSANTGSTVSNVITLGNSSIATIRAQVTTITSLSDMRDKTDILPLNYGMNFIDKLKPVSFVWDMRDGGKIGIPEIGFIAQDLQQAQIDTGVNIPNLVSGVEEKLEASYGVLLPIIVKALQEANDKIKSLEHKIINLENK